MNTEEQKLKLELSRYIKENSSLTNEIVNQKILVNSLRRDCQHKQDAATRLIAQRNYYRFGYEKVLSEIKRFLRELGCEVSQGCSIFELTAAINKIIIDATAKYIPLKRELEILREQNASLQEEKQILEIKNKKLLESSSNTKNKPVAIPKDDDYIDPIHVGDSYQKDDEVYYQSKWQVNTVKTNKPYKKMEPDNNESDTQDISSLY